MTRKNSIVVPPHTKPDSTLLDYAGYAFPVDGLGPGARRLVLWVRGCDARCPGCITPELWEPGDPTLVTDIVRELLPLVSLADGISISGGEPFRQPAALCALIDALRVEHDVEVLVYTGRLFEELVTSGGATAELLARIDLLLDGPFVEEQANTLRWRGSDNQRVHLLTPRAQRHREESDLPMPAERPLQVQQTGPQRYRIVGIPRRGDLDVLRNLLAQRGWEVSQDHG